MVQGVLEHKLTHAAAAARHHVSVPTVRKWVGRSRRGLICDGCSNMFMASAYGVTRDGVKYRALPFAISYSVATCRALVLTCR
jgi:hypothetical protein